MADFDAIIIGSGHNSLTAALYLAHAGWRVAVMERAAEIGGGMATAEVTLPGFKHDLYATNLTLFSKSPVVRDFRSGFAESGVRFLSNGYPYASVYDGAKAARVYTDVERTEREIAGHATTDLDGWRSLVALFKRTASRFLPLFDTMLPSAAMVRQASRIAAAGPRDALRLARIFWMTPRQFGNSYFRSEAIKGLFSPWSFHLDFGPDVHGGATFSFINGMAPHLGGMSVVEGGAVRIVQAFRAMIEARGGRIFTGANVTRIRLERGRTIGVDTALDETFTASRAVIAGVPPARLFGGLIDAAALPAGFLRRITKFRYGPGTFVVHLALARPLEWRAAPDLAQFNYLHICGTGRDIERTYGECRDGKLPSRPMLIFSQTTQVDPSRAPPGGHIARLHVRAMPHEIKGDAADRIAGRDWPSIKEAFADRLIDLVAEHAPNVKDALLARHVVSTGELAAANPNFVYGDCNGGSHHLNQNYFCRPMPGWSRYATPIEKLYMIGAATWPGGGVHGGSGYLVAKRLIGELR